MNTQSLADTAQENPVRHSFAFRRRGALGALFLGPAGVAVMLSKPLVEHDSPADYVMEAGGLLFFLL
jgi:hypothetical protein